MLRNNKVTAVGGVLFLLTAGITKDAVAFAPLSTIVSKDVFRTSNIKPMIRSTDCFGSPYEGATSSNQFAPLFQRSSTQKSSSGLKSLAKARLLCQVMASSARQRQWNRIQSTAKNLSRWIRRSTAAMVIFLSVFLSALPPAVAGGSSGRMGGSFGSSGGRSGSFGTTRVYSSSPGRVSRPPVYNSSPWSRDMGRSFRIVPMRYGYLHQRHRSGPSSNENVATTTITNPDGTITVVRKESRGFNGFSLSDVLLVTGAATWVAHGISKHYQDRESIDDGPNSPLGPGFSVLTLTACLNVPDRNDPNSILQRLNKLSQESDTSNRKGLQDLMAEASLEMARQEKSIVSVESHFGHTKTPTQAERQYNRQSAQQRSKFDRESLSNYGGKRLTGDSKIINSASPPSSATVALVTIHLAIEGNSLRAFDNIKSRKDLKDALSRISGDVQVEDCLLAAEVIWSPEDPTEQMTMEDIYSDFPSLYTLLD